MHTHNCITSTKCTVLPGAISSRHIIREVVDEIFQGISSTFGVGIIGVSIK